ncbi:extracellular solute-binding protein [Helicobacter burdigaliensis]|uniref:extracellular solute-binding protein n=1 Tax=Helicobacter burdigaliensis TaxID=2315334 RepID=UPI000EF668B1|nr:extracellular solute-binding protein [Helicobacter burdigaliensis]
MRVILRVFGIFCLLCSVVFGDTYSASAFAINGEVKYKDLKAFDYVNVNAKKGGHIKKAAIGTYDSFYNFLLKGTPAEGLELLYDTLMVRSLDEPSSQYGLIAKQIQRASDNSFVIFHLDPKARFNDGKEVSAFDVEFSFNLIARGDNPITSRYYKDIKEVIVVDKYTIRFNFSNSQNRELALILGDLPILPKHYYENKDLNKNSLLMPLGSGPYTLESYEAGRTLTYKRVENYWAKDHPTRIGYFNFDRISIDYYKDDAVALEAFKAGRYDYRLEMSAKNWAKGYEGNALKSGAIKKQESVHMLPSGMQGFVFNLRKPIFADIRVREALSLAFDFEWSNKNLFFNQYTRTKSYFDNSEFASVGIPLGEELKVLQDYKDKLPQELFGESFTLPSAKGDGNNRENLKKAQELLKQSGFVFKNGKLYKDNKPFVFELLLVSPAMERVAVPYAKNLQRLGVEMKIRVVDLSQYLTRLNNFEYDMIVAVFPQSLSPGNEQSFFWGSKSADEKGSRNYAGIKNEVVDSLIEKIIKAKSYQELVTYTRALDRVLLWGYYVIPHFHNKAFRMAYWDFLEHPAIMPIYDIGFDTWWFNESKYQELIKKYPSLRKN